ncbi:hypothetical protein ACRRTK_001668 [Alexandromys fortis]
MPMVAYRPGGTEAGAGLHPQYPRRPSTLHPQHPGSGNAPPSCRAPSGAGGSLALPATPGLLTQRQLRFCEGPESGAAGRVSVQTPRGTCNSSDHERCARSRMCGPKEQAGRREDVLGGLSECVDRGRICGGEGVLQRGELLRLGASQGPKGTALPAPQDGAPGNQVLAVPLEMPEAQAAKEWMASVLMMPIVHDLVSFDVVPWYLTEQNWLNLSLNLEQQAVAYSRTVTSIESSFVTSHQKMAEEAQLQEMASRSSPRANDPSAEVKQNGDSGGRGGSPQSLPIEYHFACKECGDTFRLKVLLVQHQRVHSEEKGWECGNCRKVFRGVSEFNEHRKSHAAVATQPQPGPSWALEGALQKREQMEREAKPFECEECGKRFKKNAGLSQHLRVHSREKPFDCEECGQSFKANTNLFRHQKLHSSEKPFACKACSRDFLDRQELLKHQRMHMGHLPFDCDDCGKSFRANDSGMKEISFVASALGN